MRQVLIFAAVLTGLGLSMAETASKRGASPSKPVTVAAAVIPNSSGYRSHIIPADARGHFQVDARVDNTRVGFMVDTGASVVALTAETASRVGVRPARSDYTANVSTANGTIKAARVRLPNVEIGELKVRDVDALVMPEGALSENLLGLSFLSKLKRYEYVSGKLVLEQ